VDHVQAKAVPALRRRTPVLLELENVTFKYPSRPEATALHEISFAIGEGQSVGITGASGSGKSTIFTLILRFHDPSSGRIYFRGHATTSVPTAALRAWVEYVPQDAYLFTGTLADNIRYGSPHASGRQAKNAARVACVDEFAESLPRGYETPVGANGVQLSAGQKQRIALARAVLKGGSLLLLDEATSALDATTESAVLRNLSALAGPRTILSIAHRLSSFSYSSKILVVGDGRLFAERSPSEMVESTERGMRESQLRRAI
ncbi:MAG: ABC transporter ATP-binding protein, partial [Opitutaceae bacterium]